MFLSPLGERLGEGALQETVFELTPSPNLSAEGERNKKMLWFVGRCRRNLTWRRSSE